MTTYPVYPNGIPENLQAELKKMPISIKSPPSIRRIKREIQKPLSKRSLKWKWFILLLQKTSANGETGRLARHWIYIHQGGMIDGYIKFPKVIRAMAIDPAIQSID